MSRITVKKALISVSDKTGVDRIARALSEAGAEILSTGGTAQMIRDAGIPVTSVDSYTGHPEIMNGRVKTLHPKVHGGILAVRDDEFHQADMQANDIDPIDMVVVNLYPFEKTVAREGVTIAEAVENIDIGGPTMVRSSAKNHAWVCVVVDPADYDDLIEEIQHEGGVSDTTRRRLAVKAFAHTAQYDSAITTYLKNVYLQQ
ncbi:MAG: hypothetical protein ACQEQV_09645 [Fibrobacterota bacterium]